MEKTSYEKLRSRDYDKIVQDFKVRVPLVDPDAIIAAAYVLLLAGENQAIRMETIEDFLATAGIKDVTRELFIKDMLSDFWRDVLYRRGVFDLDELRALILFYEPSGTKSEVDGTPGGIIAIAKNLLEIKDSDFVADFCTGRGSFIRECCAEKPNARYYGNDINATVKEIASIRAELLGGNITIEQGNILDMGQNAHKFDVAFSNYPFGMRLRDDSDFAKRDPNAVWTQPDFKKAASSDWRNNAAICGCIGGPRRAVCIMSSGSTWNTLDRGARKWFLGRGSVEAVIALPERIFESTSIATTMIVFSHGNESVMMVDARDMCTKGRRLNVIDEENVSEILRCFREETEHSKRVGSAEIENNDYILNPVRYMSEKVAIENGVPFDSIIKNITRGTQIKASELESLASDVETDVQYLMLANIQDGIIDDELPYLIPLDKRMEKYCLKNNDLIISKNGAPVKVAVAEVPEGKKILANGNLYIIELDEKKADPYYIKAFLESDIGTATLRSIVVGTVIPNIGIEQLKKITIPCAPLEEQKVIADKYRATVDEVKLLRRRLDKALSNMKHLFDAKEE